MSIVQRIGCGVRIVSVLLMIVVSLFPPLVCPPEMWLESTFIQSRGQLIGYGPMTYWKSMADGGEVGTHTQVDVGRLLGELALCGGVYLLCSQFRSCAKCGSARQRSDSNSK